MLVSSSSAAPLHSPHPMPATPPTARLSRHVGHFVNVTSQQWLSSADTTRSVWWNIMCIVIPDKVDFDKEAFLWITGSDNDGDVSNLTQWLPKANDEDIFVTAYVAMQSNTVGATLYQARVDEKTR
jgi:hypothetical protein